jgi:hypothetical protein
MATQRVTDWVTAIRPVAGDMTSAWLRLNGRWTASVRNRRRIENWLTFFLFLAIVVAVLDGWWLR